MTAPVMKSDAPLARNTAMPAKSSITPQRPARVRRSTRSCRSGKCFRPSRARSVSTHLAAPRSPGRCRAPMPPRATSSMDEPALRGAVRSDGRVAEDRVQRPDVDDLPAAHGLEDRMDGTCAQETTREVGVEDALPLRKSVVLRLVAPDLDPGIVDEHVNPPASL